MAVKESPCNAARLKETGGRERNAGEYDCRTSVPEEKYLTKEERRKKWRGPTRFRAHNLRQCDRPKKRREVFSRLQRDIAEREEKASSMTGE